MGGGVEREFKCGSWWEWAFSAVGIYWEDVNLGR